MTLTFDLDLPKSIGFFLVMRPIPGENFMTIGAVFFEISRENGNFARKLANWQSGRINILAEIGDFRQVIILA